MWYLVWKTSHHETWFDFNKKNSTFSMHADTLTRLKVSRYFKWSAALSQTFSSNSTEFSMLIWCNPWILDHYAANVCMYYDMMASWNGNTFHIIGLIRGIPSGFPSQRASDMELWSFPWCLHHQTVEQTVELLMTWDTTTCIWWHCDRHCSCSDSILFELFCIIMDQTESELVSNLMNN